MRVWLVLLQITTTVTAIRRFGALGASEKIKGGNDLSHHHELYDKENWLDGMEFEDYDNEYAEDDDGYHVEDTNAQQHLILDSFQTHPLLQIPCSISFGDSSSNMKAVRTFCDTGAQRTVMSWECAQKCGMLAHLDRRYAGEAVGVGSCRVLGRLPAGMVQLNLHGSDVTVPSPAITVLESTSTPGVELLLGLDFLREHQAVLDLADDELQLTIKNVNVRIPFIRPRRMNIQGGAAIDSTSRRRCRRKGERTCEGDDYMAEFSDEEDIDDFGEGKIDMSGV